MADPRAELWLQRARAAWSHASQMRTFYERVGEIFYPERMDFHSQESDGRERYGHLFDSEPVLLRRELGDGIGGMLRPRAGEWFFPRAKGSAAEDPQAQAWLDDATEKFRDRVYRPAARFEVAMRDADHDFVTFGTSILVSTLNRRRDGFFFRCAHPRNVAFELDEEEAVDVVFEELTLSARQLVKLFGRERLPVHMLQALDAAPSSGPLRSFKVWRIVAPKTEHDWRQRTPPTTATVASLYVDPVSCEFLAEAHMRIHPYHVRRWQTVVPGEVWGRSPVTSVALADSRTLNTAQRALLEGLEKAIDPPMGASSKVEGAVVNLFAGGVTYLGDVDDVRRHFQPIQDGARVDYGLQFTQERRQFLSRAMLQNLLRLPDQRNMTAYEAAQRVEEWVRNASPVFEPMQADNAELMERLFALALYEMNDKAGLFESEPPEGLEEIEFEFDDRLSEARRRLALYRTREFEQEMTQFAQVASGGDPAKAQIILAKVDWDEVLKAKRKAYPAAWLKDDRRAVEDMELVGLEQGGRRLLEMAQNAPPELLEAGLAQLEGAVGGGISEAA